MQHLSKDHYFPEDKTNFKCCKWLKHKRQFFNENLFSKNNIEQNVVKNIDGATALKLDETYEIKNTKSKMHLLIVL